MIHVLILQTGKKRKKATINLENKNDNFFQYAETVALNNEDIKWNSDIYTIYK